MDTPINHAVDALKRAKIPHEIVGVTLRIGFYDVHIFEGLVFLSELLEAVHTEAKDSPVIM